MGGGKFCFRKIGFLKFMKNAIRMIVEYRDCHVAINQNGKNLQYLLVFEISSTQAQRSKQQIRFKQKMANIAYL